MYVNSGFDRERQEKSASSEGRDLIGLRLIKCSFGRIFVDFSLMLDYILLKCFVGREKFIEIFINPVTFYIIFFFLNPIN